eukprot:5394458-Alexandrium_andersonii.AAC.1
MLTNWGSQVPSSENLFGQGTASLLAMDAGERSGNDPAQVCANTPPLEEDRGSHRTTGGQKSRPLAKSHDHPQT